MKEITGILFFLVLFSCTNNEVKKDVFDQPIIENKDKMKFEERVKREIEAKLNIPATEKYTLKIQKEHLNSDEKEDAIITVNRLEFAISEAKKEKNSRREEYGFLGNFNYFLYYDGKLDKISIPMNIGSSAKTPLKVRFENIQSDIYKDVIIDYRIRNSAFRNYYKLESSSLILVFQWKLYDMIGTDNYEANYLQLQPGSYSLARDIVVYKGKIKNYSKNINDIYTYEPEIEKDGAELYHFFFDPKTYKYSIPKK
ncbi:MAG: hypothetical protein ACK5B9_15575 [Flavobacteriia bacterium]|jgi:hypothetical protein